jgi:hypothetical protein
VESEEAEMTNDQKQRSPPEHRADD